MVWQEYGCPFPVKHSISPKTVVRQAASGLLQSAVPTRFCGGQLTQVALTDVVSMLQLVPLQQVCTKGELEALDSNCEFGKKFTGQIVTGKLKTSSLDNGEPGGASLHPNGSVGNEGKQVAEPSSSCTLRGSGIPPVLT